MKVSKSRNQREGKYIAGWCYNPSYKYVGKKVKEKKRAGGNFNLKRVYQFNDCGHILPGFTIVRFLREGAYQ